jgi:hypothetical protein
MPRTSAIRAAILILLPAVLLTGCQDHAEEIAAVRGTRVRTIDGHGESNSTQAALPLADYLRQEFQGAKPTITWSSDELPSAADSADLIGIRATIRSGDEYLAKIYPKSVVLQFSYQISTQEVDFLGAEINGQPAKTPSGNGVRLSGVYKAVALTMTDRLDTFMSAGGAAAMDPQFTETREAIEHADQIIQQGGD